MVERDVVVGGIKLHYAEGPAHGPPLVLLPGQSFPWHSYRKVLPALSRHFHVFALDVRGHGRSQHTPGAYSFAGCGRDLVGFLEEVVGGPALLAGNSSGGLIALWAAAHAPDRVAGLLLEDPPLFTAEWPRMRDDCWVYTFFETLVSTYPDLPRFFSSLRVPTQGGRRLISFPRPLAWLLGHILRAHQRRAPGAPVDLWWLPLQVRLFVLGVSEFDIDFTRACVDGRMYDMDHADCLGRVVCPITLIQAASFRHPSLGLVGAMGEEDVARAQHLQPGLRVVRLSSAHVVHIVEPGRYLSEVHALAARASAGERRRLGAGA